MLTFILNVLKSLFRPLGALFDFLNDISPALAWLVIILLVGVLVLLIAHIGRTFMIALDRRGMRTPVPLNVAEKLRDPEEIESLAADAEQQNHNLPGHQGTTQC